MIPNGKARNLEGLCGGVGHQDVIEGLVGAEVN